ncbi:glycosyltransferase family 2 protein [Chitinophaga sp. 30R24]|uniref:glycosyltransferase family 2 protein n=1 Tax=Chitinophaga sp. 30R24 TaxID=3248838 RepID=UPI003B91EA19
MNIEVAIPTYNRNLYLSKLLSTIPADIKVYVSDNGSCVSDDVVRKYPNATFIKHSVVLDVFENWNAAAKQSSSEWLVIPSDDDLFLPEAFQQIEYYTNKYAEADMLIFGHQIIDENDVVKYKWQPDSEEIMNAPTGFLKFRFGVEARMPSIVFKTSLLRQLNYFDEHLKLTAGDSDLVQRGLLHGKAIFIPVIIGAYRVWNGGLTNKKIATKLWLDEIDYWQNKVVGLLKERVLQGWVLPGALSFDQIKDEVYARNLSAGLYSILKSDNGSRKNRVAFIRQNRFPWRATLKSKMRIIYQIIK